MIDFENDTRACEACRCAVGFGEMCSCEITQANHRAAIRAKRTVCTPEVFPYSAHVEQYWQESDTQDAPVPLPSLGINWRRTFTVCLTCAVLALVLGRCFDGLTKWGQQINTGNESLKALGDGTARR